MDKESIIKFTLDNNEEVEFQVYDEVIYNNHKYLLVVDVNENDEEDVEEDVEGIILKQIEEEHEDIVYELIEDEQEYLMVLELLRENTDDYDLDYIKGDD